MMTDRFINVDIEDLEAISTSHNSGHKKVISKGFNEHMQIKQIATGTLKNGEIIEPHIHPDMDECYHVLNGTGNMVVNGENYALKKDVFINIPATYEHSIVSTSENLSFIYFCLEIKSKSIYKK